MARFDNATYTFYTDTLGRSGVPDEQTFNKFKEQNLLFVKGLHDDGLILEKEANGYASAICMMTELDFIVTPFTESGAVATSESIGGYTRTIRTADPEKVREKKHSWLKAYCHILKGAR